MNQRAKVPVIPATSAPFGSVLFEAKACGLSVIVGEIDRSHETLRDGSIEQFNDARLIAATPLAGLSGGGHDPGDTPGAAAYGNLFSLSYFRGRARRNMATSRA